MAIISETQITTTIDCNGNETINKIEKTKNYQRCEEPDYIKLYTDMWCEFNEIPSTYRNLFLELVVRMSYCNMDDLNGSQLVNTGKPWSSAIMANLHWKEDMYKKGLRELKKCGAIKPVAKGVYQINPNYAGRGEWKYNPKLKRGGVENLIATFDFANKTVDTKIIYAADRDNITHDSDLDFLDGVDPNHEYDNAVLSTTTVTNDGSEENHGE